MIWSQEQARRASANKPEHQGAEIMMDEFDELGKQ